MGFGASIVPSGVERFIGSDELFFSTTDRHGVIRGGNSVFVKISGFSLDELVGAPHRIVRHPGMPAGVFLALWERLLAGRPSGAYMQNVAKDGGHYWVFATMTPAADGFLSVRMAPRAEPFQRVKHMYELVADVESEAAGRPGMSRRDVARVGMEHLEQLSLGLGFGSLDAFLTEGLTAEIAVRGRSGSVTYARPSARGPIAEVLAEAGALGTRLADLVERLEGYRVLSERLVRSSAQVLDVARRLDSAVVAAQRASEKVADTAPVLSNVARVMATPTRTAVTTLERLVSRLAALRSHVTDLRQGIALASLHNDMVAAFAAEVVDGVAPPASLNDVPLICDAMRDSVLEMSARARQVNLTLREIVSEVAEANDRLEEFRLFLGQWRILFIRHRAEDAIGGLVRPIDEEFAASRGGMDLLYALGNELEASAVPFDVVAFEDHLARIRTEAIRSRDAS
ncbi:PAS domain-containing protein [Nonomuraea cavernae]|uniref:PAS fold-3 domain-containing protein n=1 Tax=Nonomuraea cavernae TaxID=2045107 RepID=A0A918DQD6_9ACTN|nr:PAS domain-containing protein [Nonomuraea cavernae]MCA2189761.1 PAS domain-containing protein [Nonomuraea cavernae]GGO79932.1 hypothetical protein GCM10012289_65400 [Nonomuraea cavernae]